MISFRARCILTLMQPLKFKCDEIRTFKEFSMKPLLYGDEVSPPVRFVMITASLLGVDLDFHNIDLFKGENRSEFYKKINPLQKVPALAVDSEVICDSHAIAMYLCMKSDEQDLYPIDNMIRAKVDQMLYFNATILFPIDSIILSDYFAGKWPADESKVMQWYAAMDYLELQLSEHKWLAGEQMQLCDICCAVTVSSLGVILPPLSRHVKVNKWIIHLDSMPCFEINRRGVDRLQLLIEKYSPAL